MRSALVFLVSIAACASPATAPSIDRARPPWGPMSGGTTVSLFGTGFDPAVNRVYIAGREAPVVRTVDHQHLEIVIPPGERSGDAEVVIVTSHDDVIANGVFRYSTPPAIESVSPANVVLSHASTTVALGGSGFLDEEAGIPTVVVDGQPIKEVIVRDDATLTFDAPPGIAFTRPRIEVINQRGSTSARGFRYTLSDHPGLLLYASTGENVFGWFYEPASGTLIGIPRVANVRPCIYAAMTAASGEHMASTYCLPNGGFGYGRMDFESQTVVDVIPTTLYYAMVRHGDANYGIELNSRKLGTFADNGTNFTAITQSSLFGNQYGLASDRDSMWLVSRDNTFAAVVSTIDPATGVRGPATPLSQQLEMFDMVWFDGLLYAPAANGQLVSIDPATGVVTSIVFVGQSFAIDVVD